MSCVLEVYDICRQSGREWVVVVHTNLGYIHYNDTEDWRGLIRIIAWQLWPIVYSKVKRKARYDSWLRDGPPECLAKAQQK